MKKSKGVVGQVVLGVSGGIAAYKSCEIVRRLVERGISVHVVLTAAAQKFVTPLTFQTLSGNPVHTDLFNLTEEEKISHIDLAEQADLVVVAPATADLLAKVSHGICDDLLTTLINATQAPVLFAPSMNTHMWENPITQENVTRLKRFGYKVLEPSSGSLACGTIGKGRLLEPEEIVKEILKMRILS